MKSIFTCIAYLLSEHDCVIVPDLGGFVVHYETAKYSMSDGVFMPPACTVGFNAALNHHDGLLVNALMRVGKTDYKTAQARVQQFAENIQSRLNTSGEAVFPEIGKLVVSANRQIEFRPIKFSIPNISMYGFSNFYLPSLKELEANQSETQNKEKDDNLIHIAISKRFVKSVASAAAIILIFLTVSTPIDDINVPAQYAGIVESTNSILKILPEPAAVSNETPVLSDAFNSNKTNKTYYIIVGSAPREHLANKILPDIRKELTPQAAILAKDGLYRIYIAQFSDKQKAEIYLNNFRTQHPKHSNAWLLAVKG